jgi:hypothetical protein
MVKNITWSMGSHAALAYMASAFSSTVVVDLDLPVDPSAAVDLPVVPAAAEDLPMHSPTRSQQVQLLASEASRCLHPVARFAGHAPA